MVKDDDFSQSVQQFILDPLRQLSKTIEAAGSDVRKSKDRVNGNSLSLTQNLMEADVLEYILPEFHLQSLVSDDQDMALILNALISFLSTHNKNHKSQENAQKCTTKIINTQDVNLTVPGLCKALQTSQLKGKIYITKQLKEQVPNIKRNGNADTKVVFVKTVNYLLDQYKQSKGKSISIDFKESTR